MKRNPAIAMVFVLGAFLTLAGGSCSKSGASESAAAGPKTGDLTIWSTMTQTVRVDSFEALAAAYKAENPGVNITIEVMPWTGTMDKLVAAIMAKNPPDIALHGSGWPQSLAGTGGIVEMTDLINEIGGEEVFLQMALDLGKYEDGYYSMPLYVTPWVAFYRKSYLEKAGITKLPETWEEYYEMCKAVTDSDNNIYGFGADMTSWKFFWVLFQGNDVDFVNVDADGNWYMDVTPEEREAVIEVYDYMYKLIRDCAPAGLLSYKDTDVKELVAKGTIMSYTQTPELYFDIKALNNEAVFNDVGYFEFPGRKRKGAGTGWVGMGIQKDGNVELARDYVKWLYTGDRMVDFFASYPYAMFPSKIDTFKSADYKAKLPPELQTMMPDLALELLEPAAGLLMNNGAFPYAGEIEARRIFPNPVINMFTKGITAAQAADELLAELENMLQ